MPGIEKLETEALALPWFLIIASLFLFDMYLQCITYLSEVVDGCISKNRFRNLSAPVNIYSILHIAEDQVFFSAFLLHV